jgi:hypothetical protein
MEGLVKAKSSDALGSVCEGGEGGQTTQNPKA